MRMTSLNKGEYFRYNGIIYKKLEDREKGNSVENMSTGEIYTLPLMLTVDKITEAEAKPKKKRVEEKPAVKAEESVIPADEEHKERTFPNIIVD